MTDGQEQGPAGLRAVIFDMDGVLIDSEPLWHRAEKEIFSTVGISMTDAMCEETQGWRMAEMVALRYSQQPWSEPPREVVGRRIVRRTLELVQVLMPALPGALELVRRLHAAGVPLAVASSSPQDYIDSVLESLDLVSCFQAACSAVDEARGKPEPDVYLTAARRLAVAPDECLVVEDSPTGVLGALAAGMTVVALPPPGHEGDARYERAHRVMGGLEDFPMAWLDSRA